MPSRIIDEVRRDLTSRLASLEVITEWKSGPLSNLVVLERRSTPGAALGAIAVVSDRETTVDGYFMAWLDGERVDSAAAATAALAAVRLHGGAVDGAYNIGAVHEAKQLQVVLLFRKESPDQYTTHTRVLVIVPPSGKAIVVESTNEI